MTSKPAHWTKLSDPAERATARLATIARHDTLYGNAKALVVAKDGYFNDEATEEVPDEVDARAIVSDVYSASTGKPHPVHEAWECQECGQVHLGKEAAMKCCGEEGG